MGRRAAFRVAVAISLSIPLVAFLGGCSGADDPEIPEAPAFTPPPEAKVLSKGAPEGYGTSSKYQEAMERMNNQ